MASAARKDFERREYFASRPSRRFVALSSRMDSVSDVVVICIHCNVGRSFTMITPNARGHQPESLTDRDDAVGRTPWSAADPFVTTASRTRASGADQGVRPTSTVFR